MHDTPASPGPVLPALVVVPCALEEVLPLRSAWSFEGRRAPADCADPLDGPEARHWVALLDGRPVGMASLSPDTREVCGQLSHWRGRLLAVDPATRHRGVASLLLRTVLGAARELGATSVWASARTGVLPLYVALGATVDPAGYLDPLTGPHNFVLADLTPAPPG